MNDRLTERFELIADLDAPDLWSEAVRRSEAVSDAAVGDPTQPARRRAVAGALAVAACIAVAVGVIQARPNGEDVHTLAVERDVATTTPAVTSSTRLVPNQLVPALGDLPNLRPGYGADDVPDQPFDVSTGDRVWAVYLVGVVSEMRTPEFDGAVDELHDRGFQVGPGTHVQCAKGSKEAIGIAGLSVVAGMWFESEEDARTFVGLLDREPLAVAEVTYDCVD